MSTASSSQPARTSRFAAAVVTLGVLGGLALPVTAMADDSSTEADTITAPTAVEVNQQGEPQPLAQPRQDAARVLLTGTVGIHPLQSALDESAEEAAEEAARTWHVPVATYYISSPFGEQRYSGPHIGLDFAGNNGKPVVAARHGVVTQAGWEGGYGYVVTIDHRDGHTTKYAHLATQPMVTVGQEVVGGQEIGQVGSTGDSTGPHLHFELLSFGQRIDPYLVINIPPSQGLAAS